MNVKKYGVLVSMLLLMCVITWGCGNGNTNQNAGNQNPTNMGGGTTTATGDPAKGETVYANNCLACHGKEGVNGNGPNLQTSQLTTDMNQIIDIVMNGRSAMPKFKDSLSEEQIQDVAAYVHQLATK